MLVKGKYLLREKAEEEKEKEASLIGVYLAMTIGSLKIVLTVIIVQSIIHDDSLADVPSVAPLDTTLLNALVRSSQRPKVWSGAMVFGRKKQNGKNKHGRLRSMKLLKARKAKGRSRSPNVSPKERVRQDLSLQGQLRPRLEMTDLNPKPNQMLVPA